MKKKLYVTLGIFLVLATAVCRESTPESKTPMMSPKGDVIEDFESGKLENWELLSGNLHKQPVTATRVGIPYGHKGKYFIGSTETGGPKRSDYNDKLMGKIRSKPFIVKKNYISFLIGGGKDPENLFLSIERQEDGYVIHKATGPEGESMVRKYWEVSDYVGEACYFMIVDNSGGTWGHINLDDIRFCDAPEKKDAAAPYLVAGKFNRIHNPSIGEKGKWYINDHCFIHGPDGLWHLFGITHEEPANPRDEDNFAHATSRNLTDFPWEKHEFALSVVEAPSKEYHLWAPHVVFHEGTYYMFYCAGGKSGKEYKIHLATSKDLRKWTRHPENPVITDGFAARDPNILRDGDRWLMYYTANSTPEGGNHIVACRTSTDLVHWGNRMQVYIDPSKGTGGGPTESPFVLRRGDFYYLFIGPRGGYAGTDVFKSRDPLQWKIEDKVGHIDSHAAEVVRDRSGRWYVSHCGWGEGGVYLAPLYWNDGMDSRTGSMGVPSD